MHTRDNLSAATLTAVLKVVVSLTPVLVLQAVFQSHQKITYGVGLVIGAVLWYYVPPRAKVKHLLILIGCAIALGIVRFLLP